MNIKTTAMNTDQCCDKTTVKNCYQPFLLGKHFQVVPPEHNTGPEGKIPIIMNRGAFGSGEHETTRSCIEILEQLPIAPSSKILDFGCGTGILSIAAIKLGSREAWCLDIDDQAIASCQDNCTLNNISREAHHFCGPLESCKEDNFDLLLANIYGDILLNQANNLVSRLNNNAWVILSGILWEDNFAIRQKYEDLGCTIIKNYLLEEYSSILLQKQ